MLLIREVFVAKPGQASRLAKMMKETWGKMNGRVLTDYVGNYNTVVMEYEMKNMSEYEKMMEDYMKKADPKVVKKMSGYTDMYLTGRREIYRIW